MGVLEELKGREPIFHHPELGTTRADFENMMVADLWEVGASGQWYGKDDVLNEVPRRCGKIPGQLGNAGFPLPKAG